MSRIPPEEVRFHPHSFADAAGRLFWWRGGLYRGVRAPATSFVTDLLDGVLPRLVGKRLVPATTLTDLTLDGFEIVLRHEEVAFTAYPTEWCPAMLQEASLLYLDLVVELAADGLGIKDMNPWNLVFDGSSPLFVDVMSIAPVEACQASFSEDRFHRYYLDPLRLMAEGHSRLARALLPDGGVDPATLALLRQRTRLSRSARLEARFGRSPRDHAALARSLRREVLSIRLPSAHAAGETGVHPDGAIGAVLQELQPESMLELRTATAIEAFSAARRGARAIAFFDADEHANAAFAAARSEQVWLLPLVLDFTKPTPGMGFSDHFSIATIDRLRCDVVVAGDAVRYAVVNCLFTFEHVAEALAAFSSRYAIAPLPEPASLPTYVLERAPWYGSPAFLGALRSRFTDVEPLGSEPSGTRLFLCRK